jgi:hypothetical protein
MTASSHFNNSLPSENIPITAMKVSKDPGITVFSKADAGAVNGNTDTMSLPESRSFVDVENSPPAMFDIPAPAMIPIGGASLVSLLACGAVCLHQLQKRKTLSFSPSAVRSATAPKFSLFGDRSLAPIPKTTRILHDRALASATGLARRAGEIDSEQFREAEFIDFANLKYGILNGLAEYRDLARAIQRLESALKAREYYQTIEAIESDYRGPVQEEFYRFVTYILAECPDRDTFRLLLQEKIEESFSLIVSETGRGKLFEYFQAIETMIEDECGLTLLSLFKYYRSDNLYILNIVSSLLDSIDSDGDNFWKKLSALVRENYDTLLQLKPILALPESVIHPDSLTRILQYILFERRYHRSFYKFEESIALLREWYLSYQVVVSIRQEHPPTEYRQPKNFNEPIPGLDLYQRYERSLTRHSLV